MVYSGQEKVGFIGVGLMGHGIAKNIVENGYQLFVLAHRNRAPVDDLVSRGATEVASVTEMAKICRIVFICVSNSVVVEEIVRGEGGLAYGLARGSVIIDCSTSDPNSTISLYTELASKGIELVDAPLGRTPKEAWNGTLDTMVGASDEVFVRIRPLLDTWAERIIHVGGVGYGRRMKLINNFLALGFGALIAEAVVLAQKVGITSEQFDRVIRGGRLDCGFYRTFIEFTLNGDREAHKFTLSNGLKDLTYLEAMSNAAGVANPVGNAAKNAFTVAVAGGGSGAEDYVPMLPIYTGLASGVDMTPRS
ncbi:NAD(P)-dependent oxidoreductase [Aurantimonas sp. VKM B-3413]|uniref:NAD(P)-dependent oxidoreductase n=1 Tax=Aurantimonas sp. VKM B-3413 TaxID=2779401 RepID=UPI001E55E7A2|nr:NAD(P)-dependent oxidoreductase [Aurantimonas sp. VKM B-3413]MCB8837003.1 NAD(P)-dependent oxidoreductase [Aurantimonas sp. VKM B-3413]